MAEIRTYPWLRHLRAEPSMHVLRFRKGRRVDSGRGLSFWFTPMSTAVAEVPMDDREIHFLFHGRSRDFQQITVQGVTTYRVVDPERLSERLDFSIDLKRGGWLKRPMEQLEALLTGMAQQHASAHIAAQSVHGILAESLAVIQASLRDGLIDSPSLAEMGIQVVEVRVADISPTPDLEKALQMPTLESIQQQADEATFQRRAMAVEKERAIAENELQNQIELARREESLIEQRGANERRRASEAADAKRIEIEVQAETTRSNAAARADTITLVESAKVAAERERMAVYRDLPTPVILGLAAQELAGKLQKIEHLNLSPDLLGPMLQSLMQAGTKRLED